MRILHVWDQAGVACVLAKFQRRSGHHVDIFKREGYDPFGMFSFYSEPLLPMDGKQFIKHVVKKADNYDVIHIHTLFKIIPELRRKYKKSKKIVLHYHGSEVRGKDATADPVRVESEQKADLILGSTPDLAMYVNNLHYVPNPIDTDHFSPAARAKNDDSNGREKMALTVKTHLTDIPMAIQYLKSNGFDMKMDIFDRTTTPMQYSEIPKYLSRYDTYVDIRWIDGILLKNLSKTALEALSMGLEVLQHDLTVQKGLPIENDAQRIANTITDLYSSENLGQ